jgi:hypothetical protein
MKCVFLTSKMTQRIMTSCPSLTDFVGTSLDACDILGIPRDQEATIQEAVMYQKSQDWICTNLKSLSIFICGLEDKPLEWHRGVLQQLARLRKLKILGVSLYHYSVLNHDGLDLRLEAGLGVLSSLECLEEFRFPGLWQQMEEQDVRWMVQAWPELRYVYGKLRYDGKQRSKLHAILNETKLRNYDCDDEEAGDEEDDE